LKARFSLCKDACGMAGKKILIVEDENLQLTALARRLRAASFDVVAARDGIMAIATARKEQPDLILLDLGLPAGDGFSVLQRLQMLINTNTIPVIVVSSYDAKANREKALQAGAIAYYQKPVDVDALLKSINEALGLPVPVAGAPATAPVTPTPQS
jgi:DNA-binding response OmpR family regulator